MRQGGGYTPQNNGGWVVSCTRRNKLQSQFRVSAEMLTSLALPLIRILPLTTVRTTIIDKHGHSTRQRVDKTLFSFWIASSDSRRPTCRHPTVARDGIHVQSLARM